KHEQDNLKRLQQIARQVETLAAAEQISLKAGDRALRDIRTALDDRAPLPSKKDRQELQARLEAARAKPPPPRAGLRAPRGGRGGGVATSGGGGRTSRCRKSCARRWRRSRPRRTSTRRAAACASCRR